MDLLPYMKKIVYTPQILVKDMRKGLIVKYIIAFQKKSKDKRSAV